MPVSSIVLAGLEPLVADALAGRLSGARLVPVGGVEEALAELAHDAAALVVTARVGDRSGADLVRCVRADRRLEHIPVVGCAPVDGHMAAAGELRDAGITRLVFEPVDPTSLVRELGVLTGLDVVGEVGGTKEEAGRQMQARLQAMWTHARATALERVGVLEEALTALIVGDLDDRRRREAERVAHQLAGTLGTFGLPRGSRLARRLEPLFATGADVSESDLWQAMETVETLRAEVTAAGEQHIPDSGDDTGDAPRVLVVHREEDYRARTGRAARAAGLRADEASDGHTARAALHRHRPDVVLLDFDIGAQEVGQLLADLGEAGPAPALLALLDQDSTRARVDAARAGASGFLDPGESPEDAIDAVAAMVQRLRQPAETVLAVDDDPDVLRTVSASLVAHGLGVRTLTDPVQLWRALDEHAPDLLVLDIGMPLVSGVELCRVLRQDPRWEHLPVLFMSARHDADSVRQVFAAGADDFVAKPIVGPELSARIVNRLERVRLYKELSETDPLTGLANRRKLEEQTTRLRMLADRYGQPFSVALLDLDRFKHVNDTYGHTAGDAVLERLARLLITSFRGEDVAARWGGEEMALAMYGMTRADGVARLRGVLQDFAEERFDAPDGQQFSVTFSAGVAQYRRDGQELIALYRAADEALMAAKEAGRNQVLPATSQAEADHGAPNPPAGVETPDR